jgi:hypothetical protein
MNEVRRPLRRHLVPFLGCKCQFSGRVREFGHFCTTYRKGEPTVCLRNVILYIPDGEMAPIGHVWSPAGKTVAAFNPRVGDWIAFNAWVREYRKVDVKTGEAWFDYSIGRLSNLDLTSAVKGPSFADHLSMLSGKFITDRSVVPCIA